MTSSRKELPGRKTHPLDPQSLRVGQLVYAALELSCDNDPWMPGEEVNTAHLVVQCQGRLYTVSSDVYNFKEGPAKVIYAVADLVDNDTLVYASQEEAVLASLEEETVYLRNREKLLASVRAWLESRKGAVNTCGEKTGANSAPEIRDGLHYGPWTTLGTLKPGTVFETAARYRWVKTNSCSGINPGTHWSCIDMRTGQATGLHVRDSVREILLDGSG